MNYYNEFDKKAAAWLEQLIIDGLIPPGDVDTRSIVDVRPGDLDGYRQCHFFAGIGGWAFALQLAGVGADEPVWSMSCPCQPFSDAGLRLGFADPRHLWPVAFNLIRECRPVRVVGEQVASAIGQGWLDGISADLEAEGYACGAVVLGAHSVGAPHIRQRLYWVADAACHAGHGRVPQSNLRQIPGGNGQNNRVGHSFQSRLEGLAGDGHDGNEPGRIDAAAAGSTAAAGATGGVVLANGAGRNEGQPSTTPAGYRSAVESAGGLNPWADFTIIPCRDGKYRRIPRQPESVLCGLADGLPDFLDEGRAEGAYPLCGKITGRSSLLKGYGNAIVAQLAAEFIRAFMEIQTVK